MAQAISETLPIESREKKLLDGFLAGRERVREETEARAVCFRFIVQIDIPGEVLLEWISWMCGVYPTIRSNFYGNSLSLCARTIKDQSHRPCR